MPHSTENHVRLCDPTGNSCEEQDQEPKENKEDEDRKVSVDEGWDHESEVKKTKKESEDHKCEEEPLD